MDCNVAVEKEKRMLVIILFLIYAAMFALCQLIPHTIAQLVYAQLRVLSSVHHEWG